MPETAAAPALTNRLGAETSPYLLQHKDNPVAWQPWDDDAFAAARAADKPILLSVGYAACHWCHVMAHESFETEAIAERMNALFVNIKVDREERPDIDTVYQHALALLGEHGGWPLTMFLTPKGEPFWGGTYFPPEPRFGRPAFPQVLDAIAEVYTQDPERVGKNVTALRGGLQRLTQSAKGEGIDPDVAKQVAARLLREVDPRHGGVGRAPKFPNVPVLKLLWRAAAHTGEPAYRTAIETTLRGLNQGGIYDHLGGGYARYTVDNRWLVPHFEKMLYDNAQILDLLTWAWQAWRDPLAAARARETVGWLTREMMAARDPDGGASCDAFASSLDADSEGEEGKFYVWSAAEIDAVLGDDAATFKRVYDVTPEGNWEGKTILNRIAHPALGSAEEERALAAQRARLLEARAPRVRPGWDDKVLADWNGLMIAALADAAMAFDEPAWRALAERAFAFILEEMTEDGRLKHSWRRGRLQHDGLLEDYANMSEAALALTAATGEPRYLGQAQAWVETLDRHYWDAAGGGYFQNADDGAQLIVRVKTANDNAVPAGNGTMVGVLARLYHLTGEDRYRMRAEAVIAAFAGEIERNFFPLATLINNAALLANAVQIVIVGARGDEGTQRLLRAAYGVHLPNRILQTIARDETLPQGHPAHGKGQADGRATAYVCRGPTCSLPITDAAELAAALGGTDAAP